MRTAIYIRVSTKMQEQKYSLNAQKEELTKYANSQGWEIVGEFKDIDSGGKLDKLGLNALMDFVEDGGVDVVLCIDQDRLSRLDTISWEFLKSTLRDNKVKIAEPGNVTDLDNEDQEFISDLKNLIAKREKRAIVRRMMRGKRQRTREGKGWGKPPMEYNYDKNTGTYSINEKWSWIIPFIDDLYLNKGYSDQTIAHELNKICTTPRGKLWSDAHVKKKLTNKAYHGLMEKTFSNGETITVEDIYPPLRSVKDYEKIQAVRKGKVGRRKEVYPQLLRRTNLTCGKCGKKLAIHMSGDPNYSVHFYIKHQRKDTQNSCYVSINILRVEGSLINAIKSIITGEDMAKKYVQLDYDENDLKKLEADIKTTNNLKNDVQGQIDRLLPLYLKGTWSEEQLDSQKKLLENELKVHVNRLKQLQAKKDTIRSNLFNYDTVVQYLAVAERFEVLLTKEEQMNMIGTLFPSGIVYDDFMILTGQLPNNVPLELKIPIGADPYPDANRKKSYNKTADTSTIINILNLSTRTFNLLRNAGLKTVQDIYDADLKSRPGFGNKTLEEINAKLTAADFEPL
ncbi:recombinase family protein [Cytobacillus horneckiae]|uniref:recombinase family protein n=1 Tax=Cytobacillus horneckiae TaxID=549687 RepID=UPI003D9AB228